MLDIFWLGKLSNFGVDACVSSVFTHSPIVLLQCWCVINQSQTALISPLPRSNVSLLWWWFLPLTNTQSLAYVAFCPVLPINLQLIGSIHHSSFHSCNVSWSQMCIILSDFKNYQPYGFLFLSYTIFHIAFITCTDEASLTDTVSRSSMKPFSLSSYQRNRVAGWRL